MPTNEQGAAFNWGEQSYLDENGEIQTANFPIEKYEGLPEAKGAKGEAAVMNCITANAEKRLPPGTFYEIRRMIPQNYGHYHGLAWYTYGAIPTTTYYPHQPEYIPHAGIYLVGRYVTPKEP